MEKIRGFAARTAGFSPEKKVQPDFQAGFVAADLSFLQKCNLKLRLFSKTDFRAGWISGLAKKINSVYLCRNIFFKSGESLMKNDYLTTKRPIAALSFFFFPIMLGNVFQQLYNLVDAAIVGQFVSEQAVAAVGACLAFTNVFIFIANGGGIGAAVIVGRFFGAKDYPRMKVAIGTTFCAFLCLSVILAAFGLLCGRPLMMLLRTPDDILSMTVTYLNIYFFGLPFLFLYNVLSSLFNALGKSKYPLVFLLISSVLNVALDILFVTKFQLGVAGVAWATLIAQGFSCVLSFCVFMRLIARLKIGRTNLFSGRELVNITKIAVPSIFQQCTISIGLMLIQAVVNQFGTQALAGFSVGVRIEALGTAAMVASGTALSTFVAQNIGAEKYERVSRGFVSANILVLCVCAVFFLVIRIFKTQIISFFIGPNGSDIACSTAEGFLDYMSVVLCLMGFKQNSDGMLRGLSDMTLFTIANIVNIVVRMLFSYLLAPVYGISMVWVSNPIGWIISFAICYGEYKRGKWKKIQNSLP